MLVVCLVGAGPRGLSVLERLCANERKSPAHGAVTVHVVDPYAPGAGKVWRTDQSRRLLMNTVASQVTMFTDHTVTMDGPVEEGPSLYEWAAALPSGAGRLGPDDYPTRAFYGAYLEDVFRTVRDAAPAHVTVVEHRTSAVALDDAADGTQSLLLADGTRLTGLDAVVLAQGHLPVRPAPGERRLAGRFGPANPADLDLSPIAPGETVFVRGLGLNFFDVLALLTQERGGTFVRDAGRLRYEPSGREPRIVAGSRRGVPYHARGENQKGAYGRHEPRLLTLSAVARLHRRAEDGERLSFAADLWPLIAKEVESVYYGTLLAARESFVREFLAAPDRAAEARLLDAAGVPPGERWDWERVARPWLGRDVSSPDAYRAWLLGHLADDVRAARAGNVRGPLKAALDVLRDLRNEIRAAVDHGRLEGGSYRDDVQGWYTPLNAFLSIGPPVSRVAELVALIEAGVVEVLGPEVRVSAGDGFSVVSGVVPGPPVRATALIEARLPEPDLARTADPLLRGLLESGRARRFSIAGTCGTEVVTRGLAVTERPYRLVDATGRAHPRRFALGVPTEGVHWVTATGIRPGVDSMILGDTDAVARAVLALGPRGAEEEARGPGVSSDTTSGQGLARTRPADTPAALAGPAPQLPAAQPSPARTPPVGAPAGLAPELPTAPSDPARTPSPASPPSPPTLRASA
ncbi:FAD/NAD(P)-binding protein [Streptomyces acidiscabies]|uniref:FAD/NAD(P)-binding protein n=1 Tax=Streptomyces acidiscabies TaxID=42234 RepID=UPI0038F7AE2D